MSKLWIADADFCDFSRIFLAILKGLYFVDLRIVAPPNAPLNRGIKVKIFVSRDLKCFTKVLHILVSRKYIYYTFDFGTFETNLQLVIFRLKFYMPTMALTLWCSCTTNTVEEKRWPHSQPKARQLPSSTRRQVNVPLSFSKMP